MDSVYLDLESMCHADVIISFLQIFPNQAFVKFLC